MTDASSEKPLDTIDFLVVRDHCLLAGGMLQRFKPGGLTAMADKVEADMKKGKALLLSTVHRRRAERLAAMLRAAENFRHAAKEYVASMELIDPEEQK